MSSTYQHAGVTVTRKIGPAEIRHGHLVKPGGGDPTLIELFVGDGAEIAELTPVQAVEVGTQLVAASGAIGGWKGE